MYEGIVTKYSDTKGAFVDINASDNRLKQRNLYASDFMNDVYHYI